MYYCQYCNKEYKDNGNKTKHEKYFCKLNPLSDLMRPSNYCCRYCGKKHSTAPSLGRHEISCNNNPEGYKHAPWNKGLTKETSDIIRIKAEKFSRRVEEEGPIGAAGLKGNLNPSTRPEVRSKVSAKMKGNHHNDPNKTGRGKKGWYKGFFCSSTYELAFVIYCLDHNINIQRFDGYYDYVYNEEAHRYYPDFIIDNCIYEIKGYYTDQVKAKTEAVTDREIKVLYRDDLKEVFDYILSAYNKKVDKNIQDLYE